MGNKENHPKSAFNAIAGDQPKSAFNAIAGDQPKSVPNVADVSKPASNVIDQPKSIHTDGPPNSTTTNNVTTNRFLNNIRQFWFLYQTNSLQVFFVLLSMTNAWFWRTHEINQFLKRHCMNITKNNFPWYTTITNIPKLSILFKQTVGENKNSFLFRSNPTTILDLINKKESYKRLVFHINNRCKFQQIRQIQYFLRYRSSVIPHITVITFLTFSLSSSTHTDIFFLFSYMYFKMHQVLWPFHKSILFLRKQIPLFIIDSKCMNNRQSNIRFLQQCERLRNFADVKFVVTQYCTFFKYCRENIFYEYSFVYLHKFETKGEAIEFQESEKDKIVQLTVNSQNDLKYFNRALKNSVRDVLQMLQRPDMQYRNLHQKMMKAYEDLIKQIDLNTDQIKRLVGDESFSLVKFKLYVLKNALNGLTKNQGKVIVEKNAQIEKCINILMFLNLIKYDQDCKYVVFINKIPKAVPRQNILKLLTAQIKQTKGGNQREQRNKLIRTVPSQNKLQDE